jgi:hypothetical protein
MQEVAEQESGEVGGLHAGVSEAGVTKNPEEPPVTKYSPEVQRVLNWRKTHPDRYRKTQRELMRKRRGSKSSKEASGALPDPVVSGEAGDVDRDEAETLRGREAFKGVGRC